MWSVPCVGLLAFVAILGSAAPDRYAFLAGGLRISFEKAIAFAPEGEHGVAFASRHAWTFKEPASTLVRRLRSKDIIPTRRATLGKSYTENGVRHGPWTTVHRMYDLKIEGSVMVIEGNTLPPDVGCIVLTQEPTNRPSWDRKVLNRLASLFEH